MNLVVITSVIKICDKPVVNYGNRSLFYHVRRQHDTLRTIYSIKSMIPDCKIMLVECSDMSIEQQNFLAEKVDYFLYLYNDEEVVAAVDSPNKALGETILTIRAIDFIQNNNIEFKNFFKISGRYWFNDLFYFPNFDNENAIFRTVIPNSSRLLSKVCFKLPKSMVNNLLEFLVNYRKHVENIFNYEEVIAKFALSLPKESVQKIDSFGVNGFSASDGTYLYL